MARYRRHAAPDFLSSLWFMPSVFVGASLIAGYVLSQVEISDDWFFSDLIFSGTATNARQLLSVVSATMITVTGLVFVLTVVALQIASTQFSPRLLHFFLRDFGTRLVLSTFVATFAYSLAGLFTVGQEESGGEEFLPQIAVTGALLLAFLSVGMLVYFIQHITNSIRIDTVMKGVEYTTVHAIEKTYTEPVGAESRSHPVPEPPDDAFVVPLLTSGYIQGFDMEELVAVAASRRATIRIRSQTGHHLVEGSGVGWAWSDERALDQRAITEVVNHAVRVKNERTTNHDIGFGLRQLVDVAMRAVAPSINDPYTAVQAIQHLSVVFTTLARVKTDDRSWVDETGKIGVFVPVVPFEQHLSTVCSHIRRASASRPRVIIELLRMLETVAASNTTDLRRAAVARECELLISDAEREIRQPADLEPVRAMYEAAMVAAGTGAVAHFTVS